MYAQQIREMSCGSQKTINGFTVRKEDYGVVIYFNGTYIKSYEGPGQYEATSKFISSRNAGDEECRRRLRTQFFAEFSRSEWVPMSMADVDGWCHRHGFTFE